MRTRLHTAILSAFAMTLCEATPQDVLITSAAFSGDLVLLEWEPPTNRFIVEQAPVLTGEYLCVASSTSTVASSIQVGSNSAAAMFFRLRHGLQVAVIPDPQLSATMKGLISYKHSPTNKYYDVDFAGITNLFKDHGGITNITGLEYCASLTHLVLFENDIWDVRPMSNLTALVSIELGYNDASDLSPLAGLTNLLFLGITQNSVTDISFVTDLRSLRELWAAYNPIADLGPLSTLTNLEVLALANCVATDLAPLASLTHLREIYFLDSPISDITPLAALTNIHTAHLNGNQITDVQPLISNAAAGGLGHGDRLELVYNPLSEFARTNQIPILRDVYGIDVVFYE